MGLIDGLDHPVTGSCKCGESTVTQRRAGGMAVWKCHCSHCRKACEGDPDTKGQYGFNTVDWCCNVKVTGPVVGQCTTWAPCGLPCPIWCANRKRCKECGSPLIATGYGAFTGFTIVDCAIINRGIPDDKPKLTATFDNFYNSGLKKGEETSKTYYGDACSTWSMMYEIVLCGFTTYGSGHCCCVGWGNPAQVTPAMERD
jgi:hypothetical protein